MLKIETFTVNPLSENTYVVSDATREAVIIDCGALYEAEQKAIAAYITTQQLKPVASVLTHGHFDHCFGTAFLTEAYGLATRCSAPDMPLFNNIGEQMRELLGHALRSARTGEAGEPLTPESIIRFGSHEFTVLPSPGHTPGGLCLYCEAEHVLFSGDSLFRESIGRTDFPGGNVWNLVASLRHIVKTLPPETVVYPGHGPATTIGHERDHNPYIN